MNQKKRLNLFVASHKRIMKHSVVSSTHTHLCPGVCRNRHHSPEKKIGALTAAGTASLHPLRQELPQMRRGMMAAVRLGRSAKQSPP